jgi:hypothetical protein
MVLVGVIFKNCKPLGADLVTQFVQQVLFVLLVLPLPPAGREVHEVPTVFVSLNFTTHLTDVPMVKCYINAYKDTEMTIKTVIDKIMGESEFKGTPNENVWCNKWQTRL